MFITSWTIDIRINIQIWLLYRRYKSEWYNFWWATIQDIAACACKVWTLFDQACGQEECSQMTTTKTTTTTTTTTDKSGLHWLATDILSWAKNKQLSRTLHCNYLAAKLCFEERLRKHTYPQNTCRHFTMAYFLKAERWSVMTMPKEICVMHCDAIFWHRALKYQNSNLKSLNGFINDKENVANVMEMYVSLHTTIHPYKWL